MTTIMKNEPHCLNCGETKHQYANNCECGKFVCGRWTNPYYGEGEEQEDVEILDSQEQPIGVAKNQEEWDTLTAKSGLKMERTENATLRSKNSELVKKNKELVELLEKARDEGAELEKTNEKVLDCYDDMEMKWFSITLAFDGARKCHKKAEAMVAELEKELAEVAFDRKKAEAKVAELEKELAEFREWNAKMRCMDNEE
jgi:chromosome segregation ATPase